MGRTNLDLLMTFPDGSHLVISTQCSRDGEFSCALYTAKIGENDHADFQVISNHLSAPTCQSAQAHAYDYAIRHFPRADALKKPPYLIWAGPPSAVVQ